MCQTNKVAPYVGAWIETVQSVGTQPAPKSHPTWVRGLKRICKAPASPLGCVAPYVGAWIETVLTPKGQALRKVAPYVGAWIET